MTEQYNKEQDKMMNREGCGIAVVPCNVSLCRGQRNVYALCRYHVQDNATMRNRQRLSSCNASLHGNVLFI